MSYADLDLAGWRRLDAAAAQRVAAGVAEEADAELIAVRRRWSAGGSGWIALYRRDDAVYAFVPGGEVQVGYDAARFTPTPVQEADYARRPVGGDDLHAFVDSMTSPRRAARLPALLVAVEALEAGARPADLDDPRVRQAHAYLQSNWEHYQPPGVVFNEDWGRVEVNVDERCRVTSAHLIEYMTREELTADLAARGLRLPTPDEWAHTCGAGAPTLFRWGDHHPVDRYPSDCDDGPHRQGNAFGLNIGQDPYRPEQTTDPTATCGGDGGRAICGDYGALPAWLSLATSYRDRPYDQGSEDSEDTDAHRENDEDASRRSMIVRPVFQVS